MRGQRRTHHARARFTGFPLSFQAAQQILATRKTVTTTCGVDYDSMSTKSGVGLTRFPTRCSEVGGLGVKRLSVNKFSRSEPGTQLHNLKSRHLKSKDMGGSMRCEHCKGTGAVPRAATATDRPLVQSIPCPECNGSGFGHCCDGICEQADFEEWSVRTLSGDSKD